MSSKTDLGVESVDEAGGEDGALAVLDEVGEVLDEVLHQGTGHRLAELLGPV